MKTSIQVLAGAAALATIGSIAHGATVYGFNRITSNAGPVNPASQFTVEVDAGNPTGVSFLFRNTGPIASSITDIYFQAPTLTGPVAITNGPGVSFSSPATPGDLPGGNTVNFTTTPGLSADSNAPVSTNGVNPGEFVTINLQFTGGETLAGFLNKLNAGQANIGIHVQSIGGGPSDSFVLGGPRGNVIPLPTAAGLGLAGLAAFGVRRRAR